MKIVMDTNVILAAMIKPRGFGNLLIGILDKEHFTNYTSPRALEELQAKIAMLAEEGKLDREWLIIFCKLPKWNGSGRAQGKV